MILSSSTGVRYVEHVNENSYRNYPFSESSSLLDTSGAALPSDVVVDAFMYPVVSSAEPIRITRINASRGVAEAECGQVALSGEYADGCVEFKDALGRHAGSLVCGPGWGRESSSGVDREFDGAWLSSRVCCPVVYDGVVSMTDENATWRTTRRDISFQGDGTITPVLEDKGLGPELRFDAQFFSEPDTKSVVRQIVFACAGESLFDVEEVDDGVVEVIAYPVDRDDICWQAHREDAVSVVVDACERQEDCQPVIVGPKWKAFTTCMTEVGSITISADDLVNYKNPIKVSVVDGSTSRQSPQIPDGASSKDIMKEAGKMLDRPITVGNGVMIGIPGVSNGV